MHRILLPLFLLYAGVALVSDVRADTASLVGQVAEVLDTADGAGHSFDGDDGAVLITDLRHELLPLPAVLDRSSSADFSALIHNHSALIRAPPACFC